MMAQEGAALMILGRKPVMERQTTVRGPGPLTHTAWICIIYAVHSQRQTCKESPGARFSPDSAKQEPGGVHSGRLHCRCKARLSRAQLRPLPALSPHQPSLPLTASTAPSDICRCVFTTSKGRVRVAATWSGEDRAQLHSQALRGTNASQGRLRKAHRLPGRHCNVL
jgi:hypothetical protein